MSRASTGSNVSDSRRKDVEGAVDHLVEREPGDDTAWVEVYVTYQFNGHQCTN
jgi:hypothetical protein